MKVLVVGGVHGDEQTGIKIVHRLMHLDFNSIDTLIANPDAVYSGCRFIETDLNKSFGVKHFKSYEEKIAKKIKCKIKYYDIILDFHNTTSNNIFGIITTSNPTTDQISILKYLEIKNVVILEAQGSLCSQESLKSIGIEIPQSESKFFETFFLEKIKMLDKNLKLPSSCFNDINFFQYSGRKITMTQLKEANLTIDHFSNFRPINKKIAKTLGIKISSVPYLIKEKSYGKDFAFSLVVPYNKIKI